jgi:preprotein translocase subunit SecY
MAQSVSKRSNPAGGPEQFLKLFAAAGLKERILFTLAMLAIYRIGVHIPMPGVDPSAMLSHPELTQNLLGMFDLFTGGALNKLSIFSMGIGPYITTSIIIQLMTAVFPKLKALQKDFGEQGRKKLQQITRVLTIVFAAIQSFGLVKLLMSIKNPDAVLMPGPLFMFSAVIILTASALFVMWMGELITERGIGNGASLLIFVGIAARLPVMFKQTYEAVQSGQTSMVGVVVLCTVFLLLVALIVRLQLGLRKIMVLGAKRNVGRQTMAVPDDYLYLPVNPSGVMAIIFASSLLMFPATIMQFVSRQTGDPTKGLQQLITGMPVIGPQFAQFSQLPWVQNVWGFIVQEFAYTVSYQHWEHSLLYFLLILFFASFYTSMQYEPRDMAENLRRSGRSIQGVKPGRPTAEFLESTLNKLVFIGGTLIAIVAILPIHAEQLTGVVTLQGLGSTSLIILVGVAIDTQRQIMTHALSARYQSRGIFRAMGGKKEK